MFVNSTVAVILPNTSALASASIPVLILGTNLLCAFTTACISVPNLVFWTRLRKTFTSTFIFCNVPIVAPLTCLFLANKITYSGIPIFSYRNIYVGFKWRTQALAAFIIPVIAGQARTGFRFSANTLTETVIPETVVWTRIGWVQASAFTSVFIPIISKWTNLRLTYASA